MFQMSSVNLTNGNYIHILMPDCCFIRLLVGYSFLVAGIILAGAAERQEGRSSLPLWCRAAPGCFSGGSRRETRAQNENMPEEKNENMPEESNRGSHSAVQPSWARHRTRPKRYPGFRSVTAASAHRQGLMAAEQHCPRVVWKLKWACRWFQMGALCSSVTECKGRLKARRNKQINSQ